MGVLCKVLEAEGIATVGISLIRGVTERARPPRALFCEFPLGRPLGRPDDPAFQHRVLAAAFRLLDEPAGPVLVDFPDRIEQQLDQPLACIVPPSAGASDHPAVAEAHGLRGAYTRSAARNGRTNVGRFTTADRIGQVIERFAALAAGESLDQAGLKAADLMPAASDIRAYYEEAALGLADHVPAAGQADSWIYEHTAVGALLREAWLQLRTANLEPIEWIYTVPQAFWPGPPTANGRSVAP